MNAVPIAGVFIFARVIAMMFSGGVGFGIPAHMLDAGQRPAAAVQRERDQHRETVW